jgi:hypothetical protein
MKLKLFDSYCWLISFVKEEQQYGATTNCCCSSLVEEEGQLELAPCPPSTSCDLDTKKLYLFKRSSRTLRNSTASYFYLFAKFLRKKKKTSGVHFLLLLLLVKTPLDYIRKSWCYFLHVFEFAEVVAFRI